MIFLDHSYTNDNNHKFLKKLEKHGFKLSESEVEHPGKQFCRFIAFSGNPLRSYQYLEFVNVKKGGQECKKPGVSFGSTKGLKKYYNKIKTKIKAEFEHKNYEWKIDNESILPGWNFVTFDKSMPEGIYPWFTEYEKSAKRKKRRKVIHPNGVQKISSFHFDLTDSGIKFFEVILGIKIKKSIRLSCGTEFYFNKAKTNKLKTIHLECKSLKKLKNNFPYDEEMEFLGKDAVRIKNPNSMWDIVITQNSWKCANLLRRSLYSGWSKVQDLRDSLLKVIDD